MTVMMVMNSGNPKYEKKKKKKKRTNNFIILTATSACAQTLKLLLATIHRTVHSVPLMLSPTHFVSYKSIVGFLPRPSSAATTWRSSTYSSQARAVAPTSVSIQRIVTAYRSGCLFQLLLLSARSFCCSMNSCLLRESRLLSESDLTLSLPLLAKLLGITCCGNFSCFVRRMQTRPNVRFDSKEKEKHYAHKEAIFLHEYHRFIRETLHGR